MTPKNHPSFHNGALTSLERLQRSRIQLLVHFPFFGQLAMYLSFVENESIGTAATDGKHYFYNQKFIQKLSEPELNFLTAHEVLHAALGHIWRRGNRQRLLFNIAADLVVNAMIKEVDSQQKFFVMPTGGLFGKEFQNKSVEEVYDMLQVLVKNKKLNIDVSHLDNHDVWDDVMSANENDRKLWKERMVQAAHQNESSNKGGVPGSILRLIKNLSEPKKNWKQLLAEFIQFEVNDYGFTPPDKRLLYADIIFPNFADQEETVRNIVFAVDTSGSIGEREYQAFISEIVGCMAQFADRIRGTLIYCDDDFTEDNIYELSDVLSSVPSGGGGTSFVPVFDWVNKNMIECAGVVYLTDAEGSFPSYEPSYPVLWVITDYSKGRREKATVPFGTIAHLEIT